MLDRLTPKRVYAQVQMILRESEGPNADTGKEAVQAWAHQFVVAWIPTWTRGSELTEDQAVYLGQMFEALVRRYVMAQNRRARRTAG